MQKLENIGGQFQCVSSRELIMYQAMIFHKDLDTLMDIMGQIVRHPKLHDQEIEEAKMAASYEVSDSKWDPLATLPEKLHAIAFRDPSSVNIVISIVNFTYPSTYVRRMALYIN